ncbi:MAG: hypothetical protein IKC82_02105 [Lentisphaeria bacterium]|nr:hypothetical protein [Lentisphaeria bacterium]
MEEKIIYDGHIHIGVNRPMDPAKFLADSARAGIGGGLVLSPPPVGLPDAHGVDIPAKERMIMTRDFCEACGKTFFPCFWIDPIEKDAVSQVKLARQMGMRALKVICSHHAPSAGLPVYQEAAKYDLPILFHSGILWDGMESGKYNRPCEFECLQEVYGIRFALAHIAWPWTDECVALFGKLQNGCRNYGRKVDFFIDASPGTPDIYRKQVFRNFAFLGYDLTDRLISGIDSNIHNYNWEWGKYMLEFDRKMFADLNEEFRNFNGYLALESFRGSERPDLNRLFENSIHKNLLRFIGEKV